MDKAEIDSILRPAGPVEDARREQRVREDFWRTVKRAARQIPFIDELIAAYYCALDPETPLRARGMLLAALAYFVLPLDMVPDFILALGFTDDITVLATALGALRPHIRPKHRAAAKKALAEAA